MKHTEGQWKAFDDGVAWFITNGIRTIAVLGSSGKLEMDEANARLIAAAPEMLELLQEVNCECHKYLDQPAANFCGMCQKRFDLISKIEGRE